MKILIFCENTIFSGGRYYTLFIASALSLLGHEVKIVTNAMPIFAADFKDVPGFSKIQWFVEHKCDYQVRGYDAVISVPKKAGMLGYKYSLQHNVPLYAFIFETPNFISKYRHGDDSYDTYWKGYKESLIHATKIITISNESKKYVTEWVKCDANKIGIIHPCINNIEADKVGKIEQKDEIVTLGRFLDFKRVDDLLKVAEKLGRKFKINYITSERDYYGVFTRVVTTAQNKKIDIKVYDKISDKQKFEIIKQSKVLVHPSCFEGFGIPPAEALYIGRPAVVYDLPVYKDFYGNNLTYVEMGNIEQLSHSIEQLNHKIEHPVSKTFKQKLTYERLVNDVKATFFSVCTENKQSIEKEITLEEF